LIKQQNREGRAGEIPTAPVGQRRFGQDCKTKLRKSRRVKNKLRIVHGSWHKKEDETETREPKEYL